MAASTRALPRVGYPRLAVLLAIVATASLSFGALTRWINAGYGLTASAPVTPTGLAAATATSASVAPSATAALTTTASSTNDLTSAAPFVQSLSGISGAWAVFTLLGIIGIALAFFITNRRIRLSVVLILDLIFAAIAVSILNGFLQESASQTGLSQITTDPSAAAKTYFIISAICAVVLISAVALIRAFLARARMKSARISALIPEQTATDSALPSYSDEPYLDLSKNPPAMAGSASPFTTS
ncbi:MAG: hypothetical protein WCL12_00805 [Actinomycetes bacterium]